MNIDNYRYDSEQLYTTLIHASLPRTIVPGWEENLDYEADDVYRYHSVTDGTNPQVRIGEAGSRRRYATFETAPVSLNITKIEESIGYSSAQLAKMMNGELPFDARIRRIIKKFGETEERLFFAGDPAIPTSNTSYALTNTTNASTAWGATAFNVADATDPVGVARKTLGQGIGQLIDTYKGELRQYPLFLVVSPDVYKLIVNMPNSNTDASCINLLTNDLKTHGANTALNTHVFMSKYLFGGAGGLDFDGEDVILETEGTTAAALIAMDPNSFYSENSPFFQRNVDTGRGMEVDLGESVLYKYTNNDAIIYEAGVTVS